MMTTLMTVRDLKEMEDDFMITTRNQTIKSPQWIRWTPLHRNKLAHQVGRKAIFVATGLDPEKESIESILDSK